MTALNCQRVSNIALLCDYDVICYVTGSAVERHEVGTVRLLARDDQQRHLQRCGVRQIDGQWFSKSVVF